jgi:hypothetical protein
MKGIDLAERAIQTDDKRNMVFWLSLRLQRIGESDRHTRPGFLNV